VRRVRVGLGVGGRTLRLLLGLFAGVLARLVMADDATGAGAEGAMMAGHVSRGPADNRTFETARRLGRWRNRAGGDGKGGSDRQQHESHLALLRCRVTGNTPRRIRFNYRFILQSTAAVGAGAALSKKPWRKIPRRHCCEIVKRDPPEGRTAAM
jgi:hypothetical protein